MNWTLFVFWIVGQTKHDIWRWLWESLVRMFHNLGTIYWSPNWWCKTLLVAAPLASPPVRMYLDVYLTRAELWEAGSLLSHTFTQSTAEQLHWSSCRVNALLKGKLAAVMREAVSLSPPRSLLLVWGTSQPLWKDWTHLYKDTQSAQKQKMWKIMNSHQIIKGPITAIKRNPQNSPELCFEMTASSSPLRLPSDSWETAACNICSSQQRCSCSWTTELHSDHEAGSWLCGV